MEIRILQLEAGAKEAEGVTVIIDVFRAFSLESVLFRNGAEKIICVEKEELARKLHQDDPDTVLIGERNGRILPGFDYGNSPDAIKDIDFSGKTVIHTTTNGTRGLAEAKGASALLCASLRNAEATADYIRGLVPDVVSLVCMGWVDRETEEDTLCAEYLKSLLENRPLADLPERCNDLKNAEGKKFFDPNRQDVFPEGDFWMCIQPDQEDFAIVSQRAGDLFVNTRSDRHA